MLYQSETLSLRWHDGGIAELQFDAPGPVNKLDTKTVASLDQAITQLEQQPQLQGVIITSAKSAFIAGADITEFLSLFTAPSETLHQWLTYANSIFNRLEDLPVPTLTAIDGYALGGGCECALATDLRVATPDARLGLPETRLGIMPGFGGTVRLPRLLGADTAMELITAGKEVDGNSALRLGLVDAVVSAEKLRDAAFSMLRDAIRYGDWQQRRARKLAPLQLTPVEAAMSFNVAKSQVWQIAGKHYPAPLAAVKTIEAAATLPRDSALALETAAFIPLAQSDEARALTGIFLSEQYVKGVMKKYAQTCQPPTQAAVLGAGIMGGGISYQSAYRGVPVLLKDIHPAALAAGMAEAGNLLNKQFARGKIDLSRLTATISAIQPVLDYSAFARADIVVEAVVENPQIKCGVLQETEAHLRSDAVLTSNTSTIPINLLAQNLQRPENFCGMHFFNPVSRMPLVEVIRGEKSSADTIARVVAWASKMGKTAIVVNDCPGFFVNRVLFPYFSAFSLLLSDGADPYQIDRVMEKSFGWPMGPAWLLDVVGIDTAHHAQQVMARGFPQRMKTSWQDAIALLFHAERYGQKSGKGFYLWQTQKGKAAKTPDADLKTLLRPICETQQPFSDEQIIERLMIPMCFEVVRCLEEKIIATPAEADIALIYGLGFPAFRGGVLRYLDTLGNARLLEQAERYRSLGPLYDPPALLLQKANQHASWYPGTQSVDDKAARHA